MFRCLQNWRMRNQLKIYFLLLSFFSTILLALILWISQNLVNEEVSQITQQISTKIAENDISNQFAFQIDLFNQIINKNYKILDKIADIFFMANYFQNVVTADFDQCPENQSQAYGSSNYCYNIYNFQYGQILSSYQNNMLKPYFQQQSLLQEILTLLDPEQYIVGNWSVGYSDLYYFAAYQAIGFYSTFNIATRPFYVNHINEANTTKYIYSDVFYNFEQQYKVTISRNLTNNVNAGIVATQFEFTIIKKFFQENFLILNENGLILIGNISQTIVRTDLYLYNSSLTGFDINDWQAIQDQIYYNITNSNCQQSQYKFLCRRNTQSEIDVLIYAKYLKFSKLIVIILKEIKQDQDLIEQLIVIKNEITYLISRVIIIQISIYFLTSLLAILLVRYICRYMIFLETLTTNHLQNKQINLKIATLLDELKLLQQKNQNSSNIIENLANQYYKLILKITERPFKKNQECKTFEQFIFPIKFRQPKLAAIKDEMLNLRDRKGLVRRTHKNTILGLLRQHCTFKYF